MAAAKTRVFPTADGALQVQQSPCQWSSPSVDVESGGRIGPPLAFTQREKSTAGSPKCAFSPCPRRRDSGAARTKSFLGTRAVHAPFFPARHCLCPRPACTVHCPGCGLGSGSSHARATRLAVCAVFRVLLIAVFVFSLSDKNSSSFGLAAGALGFGTCVAADVVARPGRCVARSQCVVTLRGVAWPQSLRRRRTAGQHQRWGLGDGESGQFHSDGPKKAPALAPAPA